MTSFHFDLSNNRTSEQIDTGNDGSINQTIAYTYNGDDQLINETDNSTYGYDNNGSLTAKTIRNGSNVITESDSYGCDLRNRMTSATINGITTSYGYDSNTATA